MARENITKIVREINKVVVGQERLILRLLVGLFTGGHVLLEGLPGLAKTVIINTLANVLDLNFQRIQFTSDLLPADLIGTMIYNPKTQNFIVKKGPVFSNIILADEINRAPAKVQSALLEAMQEKQITIGEESFILEKPFLVLATQNPIEHEGTYNLPEAQVDRFMMKLYAAYPSKEEELEIMRRMSNLFFDKTVNTVLSREEIFKISEQINQVTISEVLEKYIIELIFATRQPAEYGLKEEEKYIEYGVSPRTSIHLNLAAKALAYFESRDYVLPEDIKDIAPDVMNHRIILNYEAEADRVSVNQIVQSILGKIAIGS